MEYPCLKVFRLGSGSNWTSLYRFTHGNIYLPVAETSHPACMFSNKKTEHPCG